MAEKIRLTEEQKEKNNEIIGKISELTNQIKVLVPELSGKSCIEAYENSVSNLETKNEKWVSRAPFQVSDEEKEILRKLREGKAQVFEIPANDEDESGGSNDEEQTASGGKKRRH